MEAVSVLLIPLPYYSIPHTGRWNGYLNTPPGAVCLCQLPPLRLVWASNSRALIHCSNLCLVHYHILHHCPTPNYCLWTKLIPWLVAFKTWSTLRFCSKYSCRSSTPPKDILWSAFSKEVLPGWRVHLVVCPQSMTATDRHWLHVLCMLYAVLEISLSVPVEEPCIIWMGQLL